MNLLVEKEELQRFDSLARLIGRTRTSILTEMMRSFCSEQVVEVEKRNQKLQQLNYALTQQHLLQAEASHQRMMAKPVDPDDEHGPISIFYDDGSEYGNNNF
jgi:DNA-binding HxlR family transcriptional regulator